jgi:PadR family transcriptional regulator PadR
MSTGCCPFDEGTRKDRTNLAATYMRMRVSLRVNQSALYPALHRLEHQAWIEAEWGESENNRRAKYYALTKAGRARLAAEEKSWRRLSTAVYGVLKAV